MKIEFAHPLVLLLIPVCMGGLAFSGRFLRSRSKTKKFGELLLRGLVLFLMITALSGVSIRKNSDITTTVFLADLSDSTKTSWEKEETFIRDAIKKMPASDQAGIVVFGSDAKIEQFVSEKKAFTVFQSDVTGTATNLEQAVQTAIAMFPSDSARRLVLITDGAENAGSLLDTVSLFNQNKSSADLELKLVELDAGIEKEVYVSDVTLPENIGEGDEFQVKVTVYASEATAATVSLYSGRTLKGEKEVNLQKGSNQLVFRDQGVEGGLKRYRVTVDADVDTVTVNNTYSAYTMVEAKSKLLVIEGEKGEGKAFEQILKACNYEYDLVSPGSVPVSVSDLTQYESIVMIDVYADDLRKGFPENLETYVKDYAGGFICLGGKNSYALGGYRDTVLEQILPVKMDLEGEKQVPKIAMAMVIDHSGSMASEASQKGRVSCMDVAKQAAVNALDSLRSIDQVGVLAFDDAYTWTVPLGEMTDKDAVTTQIASITADGGTSIYPALLAAVQALEKSDAVLKHVVLLTDGQDGFNQYQKVIEEAASYGITISTVAVGEGADVSMLSSLAQKGGGRYYYSDAGTTLPRIFAQEVFLSTKSYLINEEFIPVIVNSHEVINGIFTDGSPTLLGYIASTAKPQASVVLESDREDPVLALWQYGLGRTVAWTSDGSGEWTGNFSGWDKYAGLWKNIIEWTISKSDLGTDVLSVSQEGNSALIHYETKEYDSDTKISAVITDEAGKQTNVTLKAVLPGIYESLTELADTGVYTINVRNAKGTEVIKNFNTATAMQYSMEYRYADVNKVLNGFAKQAGGRFITSSDEVFDTKLEGMLRRKDISDLLLLLSLLLFMLDILARRMRIDWLGKAVSLLAQIKKADATGQKKEKKVPVKKTETKTEEKAPEKKKEAVKKEKPVKEKKEKKKKDADSNVIDTAALLNKKKDRQ